MAEKQGYKEPKRDRPQMAGYGVPEDESGLLSWERVTEQLEQARHYWMATTRPDGRPHAVPTWGAWVDGAFYTEGGGRKIRNLRADPRVVVHLESGENVVILEGEAEELRAPERTLFELIDASYAAKYGYKPSDNLEELDDVPYPEGGLFVLRPRVAFAWSRFPQDATRFTFDD